MASYGRDTVGWIWIPAGLQFTEVVRLEGESVSHCQAICKSLNFIPNRLKAEETLSKPKLPPPPPVCPLQWLGLNDHCLLTCFHT